MSLNIESGNLRVERPYHNDDFHLYFDGGYITWNYTYSQPLSIWINGDMFMLERIPGLKHTDTHISLQKWINKQLRGNELLYS